MTRASDHDKPVPLSAGEPRERDEPVEPAERFGPLAVSRHVKDDGRALILFTRRHDRDHEESRREDQHDEDRRDEEEDRDQSAAAGRRS
jgi:hypothetical protein